ncbi:MAG: hypothetical protein LBP93_01135 [Treponema sp.]|jgi:hypothetical protein|nr:hypothetical protein [Treponema sp.]
MPEDPRPPGGGANRIGTEREWSLHRDLKFRYAGGSGSTEVSLGGYVCDGITGGGEIIEVQTGSFGPLKDKARALIRLGPLRIIHPIIVHKSIELYDREGTLLYRRKSPRKGTAWDLFKALLYAPALPALPGLAIELPLVDVLEKRIQDGRGSWRRKGASIQDKELTAYHEELLLTQLPDYRRFVPFTEEETFTVKTLGKRAGIPAPIARKTLYVLTRLRVVRRISREGNAWVYRLEPIP